MGWRFRIECAREIAVEDDRRAEFEEALRTLLDDPRGETSIHIIGPRSDALGQAIDLVRRDAGVPFRTSHPANATRRPRHVMPPDFQHRLFEIQRRASLAQAYGGHHRSLLNNDVAAFRARFPGERAEVDHAVALGREVGQGRLALQASVERSGPASPETTALLRRLVMRWPRFRRGFSHIVDRAIAATGTTVLKPPHLDHRIWRLPPAEAFHLFIDETGSGFDAGDRGAIWGVLVPDSLLAAIPRPSPNFHAVSEPRALIDRTLSELLEYRVGLIGVEAGAFAPISTPGRRWLAGVTELIAWVIRLVPLADGRPTRLVIHVEQRGDHVAGEEWEALPTALLSQLARYAPARADALDLARVTVEAKSAEGGWVDAIAHTWGGTGADAEGRRRMLELDRFVVGPLGYDLRRLYDLGVFQGAPPVAVWRRVVGSAASFRKDHVVHAVLERVADEVRRRPPIWRQLLDATLDALHRPELTLSAVSEEVAWLDRAIPDSISLMPPARLAWALTVLAEENHAGDTAEPSLFGAIAELCDELFEEDPVLVALADLHVAVAHTNRFEFDAAEQAVVAWRDRPLSVGGLRVHGRMRSACGQHAAFRGDPAAAEVRFREAIALFQRLSDPAAAAPDLTRTRIYRAIAAMDDPGRPDAEVEALVSEAVGDGLEDALERAFEDDAPGSRFIRHLLSRLAVTGRAPGRRLAAILGARSGDVRRAPFPAGLDFPELLTWRYRVACFSQAGEVAAARESTEKVRAGIEEALTGGPALRLVAMAVDASLPPPHRLHAQGDAAQAVQALRSAMPRAGAVLDTLERALRTGPAGDLRVLSAVLPFTFR